MDIGRIKDATDVALQLVTPELPDDSGKWREYEELPDDSGEFLGTFNQTITHSLKENDFNSLKGWFYNDDLAEAAYTVWTDMRAKCEQSVDYRQAFEDFEAESDVCQFLGSVEINADEKYREFASDLEKLVGIHNKSSNLEMCVDYFRHYIENPESILCAKPIDFYVADMTVEDAQLIENLFQRLHNELNKTDEYLPGSGELLPEYQALMESEGYDSIEEMCNVEGVNYSDIYDDEEKEYVSEFEKGFLRGFEDDAPNPFDSDVEERYNEAYYSGLALADEFKGVIEDIIARVEE